MTKDALPPPWDLAGQGDERLPAAHAPATVETLKHAMRRARADNAERAGVTSDLRAARLGRLELLHEALKPLVAQIPTEVDTFDIGLVATSSPRLFVDMIGFVEMGRDARLYRLLQDTRTGRVVLRESENVETMVEAVTDYVARRLLERERALAADTLPRGTGRALAVRTVPPTAPPPARRQQARGPARMLVIAFSFLIDLLGSATLFTALAAGAWYLWTRLYGAV